MAMPFFTCKSGDIENEFHDIHMSDNMDKETYPKRVNVTKSNMEWYEQKTPKLRNRKEKKRKEKSSVFCCTDQLLTVCVVWRKNERNEEDELLKNIELITNVSPRDEWQQFLILDCLEKIYDRQRKHSSMKEWQQFLSPSHLSNLKIVEKVDQKCQGLWPRLVVAHGKARHYLLRDVFEPKGIEDMKLKHQTMTRMHMPVLNAVCNHAVHFQERMWKWKSDVEKWKGCGSDVHSSMLHCQPQTSANLNRIQYTCTSISTFARSLLDKSCIIPLSVLLFVPCALMCVSSQFSHSATEEEHRVLRPAAVEDNLNERNVRYMYIDNFSAVIVCSIYMLMLILTTAVPLALAHALVSSKLKSRVQNMLHSEENWKDATNSKLNGLNEPESTKDVHTHFKQKWYLSWFPEGVRKLDTNYIVYPASSPGSLERYFVDKYHGPGVSEENGMKYEWLRLETFEKWPQWAIPYPSVLAKAGFYYTKERDKVTCFSCSVVVQDWRENMSPMEMHKSLYPNCKFLAGMEDNFPIPEPDRSSPIVNEVLSRTPNGSVITGMQSSDSGMPEVNSLRISTASSDSNVAQATRTNTLDSGFSDSIRANGTRSSVGSVVQDSSGQAYRIENSSLATTEGTLSGTFLERMKHEHNRYLTYRTWPTGNINQAKLLAKAGLYYSGLGHKVKCAFCDGTLDYTDPDQAPMTCHTRLYPSCPFVRSQNTGNVPSYPNPASAPPQQPPPTRQSQSDLASLGIMSDSPKHPEYSLLQSRINSFRGWSPEREQKPYDLAVAGFIYAGMSDCVKCFHCDGGLRNWLSGDIPWVEHARWFPHCSHVRLCKGQEFIDTIDQQYPRLSAQNTTTGAGSTAATAASATPTTPTNIDSLLSAPAVQAVLEMGYSREFVKKGVEIYIQQKGSDTAVDAQSLVDILLEIQSVGGDSLLGNDVEQSRSSQLWQDEDYSKMQRPKQDLVVGVDHSDSSDELDTKSLREKNRELVEQTLCKICLENKMCITFLPCGHLVSCAECAPALRKCPICRSNIKGRVRVYMS